MKRIEYLQTLTPKYFAEFLANFSMDDILKRWCETQCPHKGEKCTVPCSYEHDAMLVSFWLNEEMENHVVKLSGGFKFGSYATIAINGKVITGKVLYEPLEGFYIVHDGLRYYEHEMD